MIDTSGWSMPAALKMSTISSRGDAVVDEIAHRRLDLVRQPLPGQRLQQLVAHPLAEDHFVGVGTAVGEMLHQ